MLESKWMGFGKNALWVLNPFLAVIAFYQQEINFGIYFQWFGKMHPILLHFPIVFGLGIAGYYIYERDIKEMNPLFSPLLTLHSLLTTVVAIFGIFLSKQGNYDDDLLFWHQWGGVSIAYISWILQMLHEHNDFFKSHFLLRLSLSAIFTVILLFFTHKGIHLSGT